MALDLRQPFFGLFGTGMYFGKGREEAIKEGIIQEPPDTNALLQKQADAQAALLRQQTAANRPNTNTAFGSTQWTQGPDGQWTLTNTLNPQLAGIQTTLQQQWADQLRQPLETGQQARDQAISAAYGQATSRLDPMWNQREAAQRTQLLNQGLDPTSQAAQTATQQLGRERNDAYTSAMNAAIGQGTAAGQAVFEQGLQARQLPGQQLQGLFGFGGQPGFSQANLGQAPNYLGAAQMDYQNYLARQQLAEQQQADTLNGLFGLGGALVGMGGLGGFHVGGAAPPTTLAPYGGGYMPSFLGY